QLHLVGEPQGRRGHERLSGRLPRPRQHRGLRPVQPAAHRGVPRSVRRHELDGDVLPQHAGHRARAGRRGSGLRGRGEQVLRAFRLHRPRHGPSGRRRRGRRLAVGRGARVLLRPVPPAGRDLPPDAHPLDGGADPALRGGDSRARDRRSAARLQAAHAVVHRPPPGLPRPRAGGGRAGPRGAAPPVDRHPRAAAAGAPLHARRARVPLPLRGAGPLSLPRGASLRGAGDGCRVPGGLRAGRVQHRALRGQLQLARPHLVPGQRAAGREPAEVRLLLPRRFQGGVPHRVRGCDAAARGGRGAGAAADPDLPSRPGRAAPRAGGGGEVPDRPAVARPDPLPRVLQRRHRRGRGCESSDRLDRAGGQVPPADRRGGGPVSRRWAVILAGGDGVRLRSMTRGITGDERPKQFCSLVTEDTLLTETRRRVAQTVPAHRTLVVVNRAHERFYVPLLADMRVPAVMAQPENRGTAAAILYALLVLASRRAAGDTVAFYPSDHFVSDDQSFGEHIEAAFAGARERPDLVTLLGIAADRAETGYGWIEPGDAVAGAPALRRVRRFWEKPTPEDARRFHAQSWLWNSFVMVGRVHTLLALVR